MASLEASVSVVGMACYLFIHSIVKLVYSYLIYFYLTFIFLFILFSVYMFNVYLSLCEVNE